MRSRFTEDPSPSNWFQPSYALYLAFMTIFFPLVFTRHSKRLKFAVGLFVVNFVSALWALMHPSILNNSHSVAFKTVLYITMISAPILMLHVFVRPPPDDDDSATDPQALALELRGEGPSDNPNIHDVENPLLTNSFHISDMMFEPQGEDTSSDHNSPRQRNINHHLSVY